MNLVLPDYKTFNQLFIENSNLIDPQPGYDGDHPGCPLYNNHLEALEFMLNSDWEITKFTPLDAHRILTKGISFFEDRGMSGRYRNCDVFIGATTCPNPSKIPELMDYWFYATKEMIDKSILDPIEIAWVSHHIFEVIHPFIDGNGRTGRLILNKVLTKCGAEPIIVMNQDKEWYYKSIQYFRTKYFQDGNFIQMHMI